MDNFIMVVIVVAENIFTGNVSEENEVGNVQGNRY